MAVEPQEACNTVVLGLLAVVLGLIVSFAADVPSGGSIVLVSITIFFLSMAMKKTMSKARPQVAAESAGETLANDLIEVKEQPPERK